MQIKSISTLVPDIYDLVKRKDGWLTKELASDLSENVSKRLQKQFEEQTRPPTLRLSQMGPCCPRALWYSIHHPELAEPIPPHAEIKYSYGHILEAYVIALTKAAGHTVTGEQEAVYVDGITGHRDCVIDGCIVDIKSTTSRGFQKFKDKSIKEDDTFGYLDQLDGYLVGSLNDPIVLIKDRAYLFAVDKQLGHMCLYEHFIREQSIRERIADYKRIISLPSAPTCTCEVVADGKSGNIRLSTRASYSAYKFCCFPKLRVFLYADGPRYLTHVERKPDVFEITPQTRLVS